MASFSDLSNELVLLILDRVFPEDLVSFCLVSKHVHHLSVQKLARHRIMAKQNHKYCDCWDCYRPGPHQLSALLCRVLDDPFGGHYLKSINCQLHFCEVTAGGFINPRSRHGNYEDQKLTIFEAAIRSTNIPFQYQKIWLKSLANHADDAIIALLLLHSPNLERLNAQITIHPSPVLRPTSFPGSIATVAHLASKATFVNPCLQRLKRVSLEFGLCSCPLALAKIFMFLPSVTSLTIGFIGNDKYTENLIQECVTLPEASSNVADLDLTGEFTDSAELSEILKGCKNLAHLSVDFIPPYRRVQNPRICFPDITASLRISAEHSLKSLKFRVDRYGCRNPDGLVDCSAFKNLCQIDVQAHILLMPRYKYNPKAVVDRLPHSLQRLYLEYAPYHTARYERNSLRALENPKLVQLPNLRLLQVQLQTPRRAKQVADSLSGSEERFGLDYVVIDGYGFQKIFHAADSDNDEDT